MLIKLKNMALKFGTGGIPLTTKKCDAFEGVKRIKELGLDAMELEFVYQVFLDEKQAAKLKDLAESQDVDLSVHGSYFINLASKDKQKWHAGINRLIKAAEIGDKAGARFVTFHPAFRQDLSESQVDKSVREAMEKVFEQTSKLTIKITPELTGKPSQWGDLDELIELVKDFKDENIGFCFDFAHKHARSNGKFNSTEEFDKMLDKIAVELGDKFLKDMHIHVSGINYSPKGERNHLTLLGDYNEYVKQGIELETIKPFYKAMKEKDKLGPADFKWHDLLVSLKKFKVSGIVVCESPNLEHDALLLKKVYESL